MHKSRVRAITGGTVHHDRGDPIFNFLFEYYHFKPRILLQWTPGINVYLEGADPSDRSAPLPHKEWAWEVGLGGGRYVASAMGSKRAGSVRWMRDFLHDTTPRQPVLHCFGLHEWAMLYLPPGAGGEGLSRHQRLPLRVSQEEV
ncbi:unnamed protein product, partial [Discosporangium mesarthrocarpum]